MKTFKFSLLLGLVLSLTFASCKDDNNGGSGNSTPSTSDFFSIENATFSAGALPQGSVELINDLTINSSVINGGSTIISFSSPEKIKTAFVSVKGVDGYYQYDFPADYNANPAAAAFQTQSLAYYYQLILQIAQQLTSSQGFAISISCLTENGTQSVVEDTERLSVVEVGTGKLQVSLSWDQNDDVDLHLLEPNGNHIYYANPISGSEDFEKLEFDFYVYLVNKYTSHDASSLDYNNYEDWDTLDMYLEEIPYITRLTEYSSFMASRTSDGGFLDLDSNAACDIDGINNENITYGKDPAQGIYYVAVDLFEKCDYLKPGAKYSVSVNYKGQSVRISDVQAGQFDANDSGSYDSSSKYHIIGGFEITASGIRLAEVTDNPFDNGYDNGYYSGARPANAKAKLFKGKK